MEAVVLAGGFGTRLRSIISDKPKCMAQVARRPFLEWLVMQARAQDVTRFVFCTGFLGDLIKSYFEKGTHWGVEIAYSHEAAPLGTGGALRLALDHVQSSSFIVLNGDSYCRYDIARLASLMKAQSAAAVMWLVRMGDCGRFGSVDLGTDGSVQAFKEKASSASPGLANAGVYLLQREFVETIPGGRAISLEQEDVSGSYR